MASFYTNGSEIIKPTAKAGPFPPAQYHLSTNEVVPTEGFKKTGVAKVVTSANFPVLEGVTSFLVEIFEDSMRLPHWHQSTEIGYLTQGELEIYLWRSPGEASVFHVPQGSLWVIPQGAIHSLNNVGKETAIMVIGFSDPNPGDFDLPVVMNGVPIPIRDAYTSKCSDQKGLLPQVRSHSQLRDYKGPINNPFFGQEPTNLLRTGQSPYRFDLDRTTPLFSNPQLGSVVWAVTDNWPILKDGGISFIRTILERGTSRDEIWWPDANILYVVVEGTGEFSMVLPGYEPGVFKVKPNDMIFVPVGVPHSIVSQCSRMEIVGFFSKANPLPEISLGVGIAFFPRELANDGLSSWGNKSSDKDWLKGFRPFIQTPYILSTE